MRLKSKIYNLNSKDGKAIIKHVFFLLTIPLLLSQYEGQKPSAQSKCGVYS